MFTFFISEKKISFMVCIALGFIPARQSYK